MADIAADKFDALVVLIRGVKPSLNDTQIKPEHSIVEDLGLDSLDILQLSRKVNRDLGGSFDLEEWESESDTHHRSVESILKHLEPTSV
ncbi:acyl carrier protein [Streptomyces sp. NPDC020681]|uniref:acyl carrier protein n=1 Tax=Streptomyces sp. NPDC020681 TaxID=3365083 RepID=UPI0037BBD024